MATKTRGVSSKRTKLNIKLPKGSVKSRPRTKAKSKPKLSFSKVSAKPKVKAKKRIKLAPGMAVKSKVKPKAKLNVKLPKGSTSRPKAGTVRPPQKSFGLARGVPMNLMISRTKALDLSKQIKFSSATRIKASLKKLNVREKHINPLMTEIHRKSANNALKFAKTILRKSDNDVQGEKEGRELVLWAAGRQSKDRQLVCKAFKQSRMNLMMVHAISQMNRPKANVYMKDYFKAGGDLKSVLDWLEVAGGVLGKHQAKPRGTAGGVVKAVKKAAKWVKDKVEDVVDAASDMVKSVVDAIVKAGKSIASAISAAVKWTASKIKNFVHALLEAGQKLFNILKEAAKKGISALKKFVKGVIQAGQKLVSVLSWAATQVLNVAREVVRAAIQAGKKVFQILRDAVKLATNAMRKIVQALIKAGRKLSEVLFSVAKWTVNKIRDAVHALIAIGKKVVHILQEAVRKGLFVLGKMVQGIIKAGKAIRDALIWVSKKAFSAIKTVVRAIIMAGKTVLRIMMDAVKLGIRALKKVVQALYKIGRKVGEILKTVITRGFSIIRTTLEGLLAIGMQLVHAVKSIFTDIVAGFRKGFLQGLLAIVKSPLKILKEAAKAGGAIIALAFSAFMEMWGGHRGLTAAEKVQARKVFGWSINLERVKIAVASIPADVVNWINGGRPFTTMYVINFKSGTKIKMNTLIHEMTHVWQAVIAGPVYMVEALHSQAFGKGYKVTQADLDKAGGNIKKLEREQQAKVVEWYWQHKFATKAADKSGAQFDEATLKPFWEDVFKPRTTKVRFNARIPVAGMIRPMRIKLATS